MTPEQTLNEVRVALALDERLAGLLRQVAKAMADGELRALYGTNDPNLMIRQAGLAQGIEKFVVECTRPPKRGSAANAEEV